MYRVMLVDDEQFARAGLRSLIDWRSCGCEVVAEADNGEDALQLIKDNKLDIVITDIRMPVLDGLELIRIVHEKWSHAAPAFIIISGYSDFSYAQQAVRYGVHDFILKPIDQEEMTQAIRGIYRKLEEDRAQRERTEELVISSVLETIIKGEASDTMITEWEGRMYRARSYIYLFIELNDVHPWMSSPSAVTSHSFKQDTLSAVRGLFPDADQYYIHEHRGRLGLMVTDVMLCRFHGRLSIFIQELHVILSSRYGPRVFIYAGDPVPRLADVRESYLTAKQALLYKYVVDDTKTVVYQDMRDRPLKFIEADPRIYQKLIEQMEECRVSELALTIEQLFHDFRMEYYAPEAIKMNIHHCVTTAVKLIREMGGDEYTMTSLEPIVSWHDLNLSLGELKRLFLNFMTEASRYIKQLRQEYVKGGIHRIKKFIEANYRLNINLRSIAAEFYMNPVYLGQLFKKHYGVYFNEYLLSLRVDEAKRLLRQTDMRVYEIAEQVGFSSADYFVTQFEKLEHMTPSEYRNQWLKR